MLILYLKKGWLSGNEITTKTKKNEKNTQLKIKPTKSIKIQIKQQKQERNITTYFRVCGFAWFSLHSSKMAFMYVCECGAVYVCGQ